MFTVTWAGIVRVTGMPLFGPTRKFRTVYCSSVWDSTLFTLSLTNTVPLGGISSSFGPGPPALSSFRSMS